MTTFPTRRMDHVLAPNATEYERTLASQVDRLLNMDIPIRVLWDPWKCPENLLPYLAWALSVDIWDSSWPLTKRRSVVANAIKHHQVKGTLQAIETYIDLVDSQLLKATTPPAKIFSGASLSVEQREAWLAKLPQVRVYQQYLLGAAKKRIFSGGGRYNSFFEQKFPQPNDAITRLSKRATWTVNGVETDTKIENDDSYFRIFIKTVLPYSDFCNRPFNLKKKFPIPSTAYKRIVTIAPLVISPWRVAVGPQLEPVSTTPELVTTTGKEGHAVYSGRTIYKRYFVPSQAPYQIYERYAVNDGSILTPQRPSIQFMGYGRYGIAPHSAELKVRMNTQWSRYKARLGEPFAPRTKFFTPHDPTLMAKNRQAIIAAKRLSDKIVLDTNTVPGFIAGLPKFAGDPIVI
ncbi:phage tail protein I [Bradyrhizobium erythrophlei]|uniref:Phage tail protein, P2 protein I family n=1 Tax=Bradyrhizobium erythrophlei TaxID=1437360 RepID=A0A1M5PXM3_9BRAD|nr:phage tail protein I [Bradyrhizobium erythrophlei]SHH06402.1 phage tail protein, P2 protein I family [Bradyrhizobium erythrophlei]